jgi:hypothetical protein
MMCVNEWKSPDWIPLQWDATEPGKALKGPPAESHKPSLEGAIGKALRSLPRPPSAVHFYLDEGLRWIRVGFWTDPTLQQADVRDIGCAIATCIEREGPLYFHALRPRDVLFFLEGGKPEKIGMSADSFGVPLDEVLHAWDLARPPAVEKPKASHRKRRAAA